MSSWSRLVNVFRGDRVDRELDEELQSHLEEAVEQGRDPVEAGRALGSTLRYRERSHDVRVWIWLDSFRADLVFAWRQLWKNRSATAAAILSLALAMGACLSVFRLIDALLLRPLPVSDPARLYVLGYPYVNEAGKTRTSWSFDYPQFRALLRAARPEAELIAISPPGRQGLTFGSDDETEHFRMQYVSGWSFRSFGLKPALGRLLTPADDAKPGASPVAVLSYDYWTRRFGRDPHVIGRKFRMGTDLYQIVGVCAKDFTGTDPGTITDIFVPTMMNAKAIDRPYWAFFRIWVRVSSASTPELAIQKLRAAEHAYREERIKTMVPAPAEQEVEQYKRSTISLEPASAGFSGLQQDYRRALWVLGAVVLLVLLIACANLANLMTARAAARAREMALRISIGAGRWRLLQLVMAESVWIALIAAFLGSLFAWWSAPAIVSWIRSTLDPVQLVLPADGRVLAFALGMIFVATLLFGATAAARASTVHPMRTLRGGADPRARRRLMYALIGVQAAFCFLVTFTCALFVSTFEELSHQPLGFDPHGLLTVETVVQNNRPSRNWDDVLRHLRTVPGVESAAICGWPLLSGNGWSNDVWIGGRRRSNDQPYFLAVSPGWLPTMRLPLLAGRDLRPQDTSRHVAVVNQAFVQAFFQDRSPLGLSFETMTGDNDHLKRTPFEIVGVSGDARYFEMRESMRPTAYVLFDARAEPVDWGTFIVRTALPHLLALAPALRRAVHQARSEFRVVEIGTQTALVEQQTVRERLLAMISTFLASLAIVLAGVGLYGVLTYTLLQRRKELGIRLALGAPRSGVLWRLAAEFFAVLAAGAGLGIAAGVVTQPLLQTLLYQIKGTDPRVVALPCLTIGIAALLAALAPLRHALQIDPAGLLRAE